MNGWYIGDYGPESPPEYPHDPECDPNDEQFLQDKTNARFAVGKSPINAHGNDLLGGHEEHPAKLLTEGKR